MTGDEARVIRNGMRLSAAKLAVLIGTDRSTVYRFEKRGDREVPRMYAHALRNVLRERAQEDDESVRRRPGMPKLDAK